MCAWGGEDILSTFIARNQKFLQALYLYWWRINLMHECCKNIIKILYLIASSFATHIVVIALWAIFSLKLPTEYKFRKNSCIFRNTTTNDLFPGGKNSIHFHIPGKKNKTCINAIRTFQLCNHYLFSMHIHIPSRRARPVFERKRLLVGRGGRLGWQQLCQQTKKRRVLRSTTVCWTWPQLM